jgi:hypothetical protein
MSLYDLQQRTDLILKKYEKYDAPMGKRGREGGGGPAAAASSDDPFENELAGLEQSVEDTLAASKEAAGERNRATAAARNAEVRRAKQRLLDEGVPALNRKLKRGKGVTPEIVEERQRRVKGLIERVYAIPDGLGGGGAGRQPSRPGSPGGAAAAAAAAGGSSGRAPGGGGGGGVAIALAGPTGALANPLHYKATEETDRFDADWSAARAKQDAALERLERGVAELGGLARGAQEELDRQGGVLDDVDAQLNRAAAALRGNNRRLKGALEQVRSTRNFCLDFVLVAVLLGIAAWLASTLNKRKAAGAAG